jgi:hypothetical protein
LIWETVLTVAKESRELDAVRDQGTDRVVLLSTNTKDFGREDGELADELREDLEALGCPRDYVRLVSDLRRFNDEYISPETVIEDELRSLLTKADSPQRHQAERLIREALARYVFDPADIRSFDPRDFDVLSRDIEAIAIETATIERTFDPVHLWLVRANPIDDDVVLIDVDAELDADVEVGLELTKRVPIWEVDDGGPLTRLGSETDRVTRTLTVSAEGQYRRSSQSLEELHVYHVAI